MSLISSLFIILKNYRRLLSEYYKLTGASVEEFAHHINESYAGVDRGEPFMIRLSYKNSGNT